MSDKNQKILLIDDSEETIAYLTKALTASGFEVMTARNGADGLNMFDKIKPDITLLNLLMPIMDGFETLRKILQIDHDAKVIITSAIDSHEMINRCLNKGAISYVTKPIRCVQLIFVLQHLLKSTIEKRINQMFLMLAEKLQTAGRKLYEPSLTVLYYESSTHRPEASPYVDHQFPNIRRTEKIVEPIKLVIPDKHVGYIGTITGQEKGAIICIFKEEDVKWFNTKYGVAIDSVDIIMCKMFSILADNTRLTLDYQLPRKYEESDHIILPNEVTKAKFEFRFPDRMVVSEIQLWFNLSSI